MTEPSNMSRRGALSLLFKSTVGAAAGGGAIVVSDAIKGMPKAIADGAMVNILDRIRGNRVPISQEAALEVMVQYREAQEAGQNPEQALAAVLEKVKSGSITDISDSDAKIVLEKYEAAREKIGTPVKERQLAGAALGAAAVAIAHAVNDAPPTSSRLTGATAARGVDAPIPAQPGL